MLLLVPFVLIGCAALRLKVDIPNTRWYGDKGPLGAHWFYTMSDESGDIGKEDWDELRFGMICTDSDSWADWQASMLKLCGKNRCSYEVVEAIKTFNGRIKKFQKTVER